MSMNIQHIESSNNLGGWYSRASSGIFLHVTETFLTYKMTRRNFQQVIKFEN